MTRRIKLTAKCLIMIEAQVKIVVPRIKDIRRCPTDRDFEMEHCDSQLLAFYIPRSTVVGEAFAGKF